MRLDLGANEVWGQMGLIVAWLRRQHSPQEPHGDAELPHFLVAPFSRSADPAVISAYIIDPIMMVVGEGIG